MNCGLPPNLTWYKLLVDQGSFIAGILALLAGVVAYIAGYLQAKATKKAAEIQVRAVHEQLEADQEATKKDRDRRQSAMAWAIRIEAKRIHSAAHARLERIRFIGPVKGVRRDDMIIGVFDLARGSRPDISLLHLCFQTWLSKLVEKVDLYNSLIELDQPWIEDLRFTPDGTPAFLLGEIKTDALNLYNQLEQAFPDATTTAKKRSYLNAAGPSADNLFDLSDQHITALDGASRSHPAGMA